MLARLLVFIGMIEALWKSLTCQASATGETAEAKRKTLVELVHMTDAESNTN